MEKIALLCVLSLALCPFLGSRAGGGIPAGSTSQPSASDIDELRSEIELLKLHVADLQAQLDALKSQIAGKAAPLAPTGATPSAPSQTGLVLAHAKIQRSGIGNKLIADITNQTGRGYQSVILKCRFYNSSGDLLEVGSAVLNDFQIGSEKALEVPINTADPAEIASYKIDVDSGY